MQDDPLFTDGAACGDAGGCRRTLPAATLLALVLAASAMFGPSPALAGGKNRTAGPARGDRVYSFVDRANTIHFSNIRPEADSRWKPLRAALGTGSGGEVSRLIFTPGSGKRFRVPKDRLDPANPAYATNFVGPPSPRARGVSGRLGPDGMPPRDLTRMIDRAAQRHGVEPELVHAVVRAESGYNDQAVSRAGAMGLMQLMPGTADMVGVSDAFEPAQNVEGGTQYLRMMLDRFGNDLTLAIAAYNAGPSAVENYGGVPPYRETREYLGRVLRFRDEFLANRTLDRVRNLDRVRSLDRQPIRLARSFGWPAPRR